MAEARAVEESAGDEERAAGTVEAEAEAETAGSFRAEGG